MSYLVLARKYRPQTFDDIVGQEHVTRTLRTRSRQGRVAPRVPLHAAPAASARPPRRASWPRPLVREGAHARRRATCATPAARSPPAPASTCRRSTRASNNGVDNIRELRDAHPLRAGARQEEGLHPRRSAHALGGRVQRAAQDARGAAAARGVHLRDDRSAQAAGDDPVARAALRLQAGAAAAHRRAPGARSSTTRRSRTTRRRCRWSRASRAARCATRCRCSIR